MTSAWRAVDEVNPLAPSKDASLHHQEDRLRALVNEHVDFIWRSLRRLGVAEADLPDAAQHVFFVTSRKLSQLQVGAERGFLFQAALRVAANARRRRGRRREVSDEVLGQYEDSGPSPDDNVDRTYCRALLDEILEAMPIDLRAVFVLYEIEETTMADIAALMGIPPGTVASRLRRARAAFNERVRILHDRERRRGHE